MSRPHRVGRQAKAMLLAADGLANAEIARRCEVDADAVRRWRVRFVAKGTAGLAVITKGRERKPSLPVGTVEEVLRLTTTEEPADTSTHWSTRSMAVHVGIGEDTVAKIWADHNRKPWRIETSTINNDTPVEARSVDVDRLHLHPTPTSSSWLNLIEPWCKELIDQCLLRGTFTNVGERSDAIATWAEHENTDPEPFIGKATAEHSITRGQHGHETLRLITTQTDHEVPE